MSSQRFRSSLRVGLIFLAASIGVALFSFVLGYLWTPVLQAVGGSPGIVSSFRSVWIPVLGLLVDGAAAALAMVGVAMVWRARWELGGVYASRVGLALLASLIAVVSYAFFVVTGILLGYVPGAAFLIPWHGLFAMVGGVALGLALYWILANLPVPGARPVAAVALGLGLGGIAVAGLAVIGLRRLRTSEVAGVGLGLAVASLILWLVLCLWTQETLRDQARDARSVPDAQRS